MSTCIRCYVSGRVQGVFFRASTQEVATRLGLKGYARNLPDSRVEVLACGEHSSLQELEAWLWQGPTYAEVADVNCENLSVEQIPTTFSTG